MTTATDTLSPTRDATAGRVLVVDDAPLVRELMKRLLEPLGYRVVAAADSQTALDLIPVLNPSVIVCDVHMPGPSGLWLTDQIRERFPAIAIVLATGDHRIPPTQSLRRGIVACLLKPVMRPDLLRAIEEGMAWSHREVHDRHRRNVARLARPCAMAGTVA